LAPKFIIKKNPSSKKPIF